MIMGRFSSQSAFLSLLLPFAIMCNLGVCELKASCNEKDKQILLCFKHGLTDSSNMLSTWSNKKDCCEWRGIQCNINGRVTNISLPCSTDDTVYGINKNKTHCLAGELNLSLFELEFLNYLDLNNNNFKAMHLSLNCQNLSLVNTPLGRSRNFSNLAYLDLSQNKNIVMDDLRWLLRLSSLEYLNLDYIDLHKQTHWLQILTTLPSLSEISLSNCLLDSASPSLEYANFTSLEYLDLSDNDFLSKLPNWLFNLSGLSSLTLDDNHFHGQIPNTLLNLRNLHYLSLGANMLTGTIPDWLGQLESLQHLILNADLLIGSIPTTLGNLSSLISLDVSSNNLNGSLPESLGQLSNLEKLNIGENSLFGVVSHRNFAKISQLQFLRLGSPSFTFDFDPHWIPPFQLLEFFLEYADIKCLPWLYTQTSLDALSIHHSSFTNVFPDKFWSWASNLKALFFFNNTMHWDMSNVLLNSKLIWLDENDFIGGLPQLSSNVSVLGILNSNLSGSLSPLLCHKMNGEKNNLQILDASNNSLSEGITDCWENWKSLVHVNLGNNHLTGKISHSMGTLSNLLSLQLDYNSLHGEIPMSLKNCQKLMILSLSGNKFFGSIPNWIGQDMKALQLRSNEFSGNIPLQICQLSSLIVLDLADNRLTGIIPHCLHNITAMIFNNASRGDEFGDQFFITYTIGRGSKITVGVSLPLLTKGNERGTFMYMHVLDLSNNHLVGKVPLEIFRLTALQSLNLSHNQLMGTIPREIGNMKQLESLDFSNNTLSGEIPQSMSALSFLSFLNLSFNNLRGQIPLGTQLQSFTALSYEGNPELYGCPLIKKCKYDEAPSDTKLIRNDEKGSELLEWFYMGTGVGFATSFLIVCGSIFFIQKWRHAYFRFVGDVKDKLYVKMVLTCTPSVEI